MCGIRGIPKDGWSAHDQARTGTVLIKECCEFGGRLASTDDDNVSSSELVEISMR
jgi:hypothetical protein